MAGSARSRPRARFVQGASAPSPVSSSCGLRVTPPGADPCRSVSSRTFRRKLGNNHDYLIRLSHRDDGDAPITLPPRRQYLRRQGSEDPQGTCRSTARNRTQNRGDLLQSVAPYHLRRACSRGRKSRRPQTRPFGADGVGLKLAARRHQDLRLQTPAFQPGPFVIPAVIEADRRCGPAAMASPLANASIPEPIRFDLSHIFWRLAHEKPGPSGRAVSGNTP